MVEVQFLNESDGSEFCTVVWTEEQFATIKDILDTCYDGDWTAFINAALDNLTKKCTHCSKEAGNIGLMVDGVTVEKYCSVECACK